MTDELRERLDLLADTDPLTLRDEALALLARAEQVEDAVERIRAEHAAIHAEADEFERIHNPDCECQIAPTSRNIADRLLAALDQPAKEET